jgi:hypothetical protein
MLDTQGALNGFFSAPLVLPAPAAGALAALFVVFAVIAWQRGRSRLLLPLASLVFGVLVVFAVVERLALNERATARDALLAREVALTRSALLTGSPLACLDAGAGETVENSCEKVVFASAQSTAAATAYMAARLTLLAEADHDDAVVKAALASSRRAVELDRFGVAAHVLATRDGCTAEKCAAFSFIDDASALKANLKAQVFDQYVSRYAANWTAPAQAKPSQPAVSAVPSAAPAVVGSAPVAPIKPGETWDYPSADSIPAVSIMNAEPPPKRSDAATPNPVQKPEEKSAQKLPHKKAGVAAQVPATPPSRPPAKPASGSAPLQLGPANGQQTQAAPPSPR